MSTFEEIEGRNEATSRKGEQERQVCADLPEKRSRKHKVRERMRQRMAR